MVRITPPTKPKKTAAQKRTEAALAAAAASSDVARRGEDDLTEAASAAASAPADEVAQMPHQVASKPIEGIIHPAEPEDWSVYVPAPEDATDLQHLAHAERQLRRIGDGAGTSLANLEADYWTLTGRWFAEVQKKGSYKAGGHKSVEKFARSVGIERHTYYRAIRHHVVYSALGDMVEQPLPVRVVEQLYILGKDDSALLRSEYEQLKANGPVTASAVQSLRRLLRSSDEAAKEPKSIEARQPRPVSERVKEARAAGKIDLNLLKELAQVDRDSARAYVDDLKVKLAEAESLLVS